MRLPIQKLSPQERDRIETRGPEKADRKKKASPGESRLRHAKLRRRKRDKGAVISGSTYSRREEDGGGGLRGHQCRISAFVSQTTPDTITIPHTKKSKKANTENSWS